MIERAISDPLSVIVGLAGFVAMASLLKWFMDDEDLDSGDDE